METFAVQALTFSYPERPEKALDGLSLTVRAGDFLVLCGPSGCGKTTLLRQLKTALAPRGRRTGEILFQGRPLDEWSPADQARRIGFVRQSPEDQLVTDKVWHELAFGLESLGEDTPSIRRKVAEMASFFGIQNWFYKNVAELSGGQKQLLNLASVMVMGPDVLILDEPTSQLDPIAAADFLAALGRINRELGTTILLTEHRLEEAFPLATRAAVLDRGRLLCEGAPREVGEALRAAGHRMFRAMPAPVRVWAAVENDLPCPVTVREGRDWLSAFAQARTLGLVPPEPEYPGGRTVLSAENLWFRYEKNLPDAVKNLSLEVRQGEFLALLGGNGTGKSTALRLLAGLLAPYRGEVKARGRAVLLPQDPQVLFVRNTVRADLLGLARELPEALRAARVERAVALCRLEALMDRHPYDLSGGEQQRAALAKILLLDPDILLLDEPTKGLDAEFKESLAAILQNFLAQGKAVVMVSHDVEFCARRAHRCALFFDGGVAAEGSPRNFFARNHFYTTAANRMARALLPEAVTAEDVIAACGGRLLPEPEPPEKFSPLPEPEAGSPDWKPEKLPRWRKLGAVLSGGIALALFLRILSVTDLSALITAEGMTAEGAARLPWAAALLVALAVFAACITRRSGRPPGEAPRAVKKLPRCTLAAAVLVLLLIPLTLFVGEFYLDGRKYYFISLLVLLEIITPFFLAFEGRRPQARELVLIAVLCALGVAGRAALFMLPQCKPVMALTILSGAAFGGETGFLVGAATMLVSNVLFSQGPLTPWQMFAMGLVGFLAGVLFQKGLLRRSRGALAVFGALASVLIYGGIMNPASALTWAGELNAGTLLTYYLAGLPFDCVQGAATALFLWFGAEPMLEKLDRIKVKYGLLNGEV